jgi:hypothetical protein
LLLLWLVSCTCAACFGRLLLFCMAAAAIAAVLLLLE